MAAASSSNHNLAKGLISVAVAGMGALLAYRLYRTPRSVRPGINAPFSTEGSGSEFLGRFEVESREIFNLMPAVVQALGIQRGDRVADLGAGTGLFLENLARAVAPLPAAAAADSSASASAASVSTNGHVYALDPFPKFLSHMIGRLEGWSDRSLAARVSVQGNSDHDLGGGMDDASLDLVIAVDAYHHFEFPTALVTDVARKLKAGGRFAVLDFERIPGTSSEWVLGHVRAGREVVQAEIEACGFKLQQDLKQAVGLKENYLMLFVKA